MAASESSLLEGTTVYLSGPMDFVLSIEDEKHQGWRARLTNVLEDWGVRVFDPWFKPAVRNLGRYGLEDGTTKQARRDWTFADSREGAEVRAALAHDFWPIMHIDLRMVDLSDFVIACCPTNLYSVGTPHEIVVARMQRKPVLMVSPPVRLKKWSELLRRARSDGQLDPLIQEVAQEVVVQENVDGIPSSWYMTLVDSQSFFDGFGWERYSALRGGSYTWPENYLDERERPPNEPQRPLLGFLDELRRGVVPKRWDRVVREYRPNDDWLILADQANDKRPPAASA